jgi:hypothetical protein
MGLQVYGQDMPPLQTPVVNAQTFDASRNWWYLWLALFNRTGKSSGAPTIGNDLTAVVAPDTLPLIQSDWNIFTAVPNGAAAQVPAVLPGSDFIVFNVGTSNLAVTPDPSYQIDALGAGRAYDLAPGKMQWFRCTAQNQILSMQLG